MIPICIIEFNVQRNLNNFLTESLGLTCIDEQTLKALVEYKVLRDVLVLVLEIKERNMTRIHNG